MESAWTLWARGGGLGLCRKPGKRHNTFRLMSNDRDSLRLCEICVAGRIRASVAFVFIPRKTQYRAEECTGLYHRSESLLLTQLSQIRRAAFDFSRKSVKLTAQ